MLSVTKQLVYHFQQNHGLSKFFFWKVLLWKIKLLYFTSLSLMIDLSIHVGCI